MELSEAQANTRFKNRRMIAKWSFALMCLTLLGLIIFALVSDENAARVANIQWLIGTAGGLWSTLTLGYYVSASYEQGRAQ